MIKDLSVNGFPVRDLRPASRKLVHKICDNCAKELQVKYADVIRSRKRRGNELDYCRECAWDLFLRGDKNPAKRAEIREKIGAAHRGKGKNFIATDGFNSQRALRKLTSGGYILVYDESRKKYVEEHRLHMEDFLGVLLNDIQKVHHIDGNKTNNDISNLYLCESESEHGHLHNTLEKASFELFKSGIISFDSKCGSYYVDSFKYEESLGFESISIKQKKNRCLSRLDADTSSEIIKGVKIKIPLIASNMSTVIDSNFCIKLMESGAFGFLHRALSDDKIFSETIKVAKNCEWVPISIGIGDHQYDVAKQAIHWGANIVLIDVAHGYSDIVIEMGRKIKKDFPHVKVVVGNTVNTEMMYEIADFADGVKIGIAQGFACETKNTAGCTEKQFSAVLKFKKISKELGIPVISDGGLREPADFIKSVAAGANSAMAGSIFASCPESAGELITVDGKTKKIYAGMASEYVQNKWRGGLKPGTCAEGGVRHLDVGKPLEQMLELWQGALRSGITYGGGIDISSFQECVEFIRLV